MEDDKKKKRNKKKKNKQAKTTEDEISIGADQNGASNGKNDHNKVFDSAMEVQNGAVQNVDTDRLQNNGKETSILTEAENHKWLQREAILKGTIKQLQYDNDSHKQKQAILEEKIKLLEKENELERHKQAIFEETVQRLKNENDLHTQKEATLEKKIVQLQSEKELSLQKESRLEDKLVHLMDKKALLETKEANLEEKIKFLENDKNSLILTETTTKETVARMNVDITRLRMQVVEFEESRKSLMKENQQLMENMSCLQLQLQDLEKNTVSASTSDELKKGPEYEDRDSQISAAACAVVDKLITENAELIEKVNELYFKLDQQRSTAGHPSAEGSDLIVGDAEITKGDISPPGSNTYMVDHKLGSLEVERASEIVYAAELEADSGEIVQFPLDDNELGDLELQADESNKMEVVPLSHAPLTGAPFRLISFVAKYVSGADLVDKN